MMPLDIFASRQFTAVNLVTLCVYAAFGGFFFLAALQLQVVVRLLGARRRYGPAAHHRPDAAPLGPLRGAGPTHRPAHPAHRRPAAVRGGDAADAAGGPGRRRTSRDVLPALLVLGLGMVTLVAPLTATVWPPSTPAARAWPAASTTRRPGRPACSRWPRCRCSPGWARRRTARPTPFDAPSARAMPVCAGGLLIGSVLPSRRSAAPRPTAAAPNAAHTAA